MWNYSYCKCQRSKYKVQEAHYKHNKHIVVALMVVCLQSTHVTDHLSCVFTVYSMTAKPNVTAVHAAHTLVFSII